MEKEITAPFFQHAVASAPCIEGHIGFEPRHDGHRLLDISPNGGIIRYFNVVASIKGNSSSDPAGNPMAGFITKIDEIPMKLSLTVPSNLARGFGKIPFGDQAILNGNYGAINQVLCIR